MSVVLQGWRRIFSPSTLSNEIVLNWLTVLEFGSFGVNIPSVTFQEAGTSPFRQTTFKSLHNRLRSSGHILYTLYGMTLGPGAEAVLAFLTTSFTSPNDGSETSSCFSGAFTGSIRSQSPSASSRLGSEWVTWRYFSTSSTLQLFSLPEPLGSQGELIVYPSSWRPSVGVHPSASVHHF